MDSERSSGDSTFSRKREGFYTEIQIPKRPKCISPDTDGLASYGKFFILGYNGFIPPRNYGRIRSNCRFLKRTIANGAKVSCIKRVNNKSNDTCSNCRTVHYQFTNSDTVVVEYDRDKETDMLQIGRSNEFPIDFVVFNKSRGNKSTVSRFACRVVGNRNNVADTRVYAGAFDSNSKIVIGVQNVFWVFHHVHRPLSTPRIIQKTSSDEKLLRWKIETPDDGSKENAVKWFDGDCPDALSSNGVLLYHPNGSYWGGEAKRGTWYEVSVGGNLYSLRYPRKKPMRGKLVTTESNVLQDGSLVDLCGTTLLWRTAEGLANSMKKEELMNIIGNCTGENCGLKVPRRNKIGSSVYKTHYPIVYFNCGHVERSGDPKKKRGECPTCSEFGPVAPLRMGVEAAFYVDTGTPKYAFKPCGHVTNKKTAKYWSTVAVLRGKHRHEAICPFCATSLEDSPGYVLLNL